MEREHTNVATGEDIRRIEAKMSEMAVALQEVKALIVPRSDIEHTLGQYITKDAHRTYEERLARLETSPQRSIGWIAAAISAGLGCLTLIIMGIGSIVAIASVVITLLK